MMIWTWHPHINREDATNSALLVYLEQQDHIMFAWSCLALLAVASAAPQVYRTTQVPVNFQTLQTLNGEYQPLQTFSADLQPVQTLGNIQTVQTIRQPIETLQPYQIRTVAQPQLLTSQLYDRNAYSTLNYQPTLQISPVKTLKKSVIKTVVQPVQRTGVSALTVQQLTPQVVPQQVIRVAAPKQRVVQQVVQVPNQLNQLQLSYQQRLAAGQQYYQGIEPNAPQGLAILRQVQDAQADGTYAFAFETENGIKVQEEGRQVASSNNNAESSIVQGSYSYQAPDGTPITVNYVADENGFRAEGEHIPKASPEIARAVEYLRSLPPRPEDSEGQYTPDTNGY